VQQEPSSSVFGLTLSVCGQGNKSSLYLRCSGCIPRPQCYFLVPPALFEYPVKEGVEGSQLNCTRSVGGPFFPESGTCAFLPFQIDSCFVQKTIWSKNQLIKMMLCRMHCHPAGMVLSTTQTYKILCNKNHLLLYTLLRWSCPQHKPTRSCATRTIFFCIWLDPSCLWPRQQIQSLSPLQWLYSAAAVLFFSTTGVV
jgi:hypothetical protein